MEKCVFIGYPQGYKGWKFYNPTTKKTMISERADFDERYFPMSKRPTSASFPALSVEVESTPSTTPAPAPRPSLAVPKPDSNPYYFPDAVALTPAPERPQTPPRPASPVAPPRAPSPIGIGARLPRRTRNKPREWWKLSAAQLDSDIDDDIEDADIAYEVAYSHSTNGTWELVPQPKGKKIIGSK